MAATLFKLHKHICSRYAVDDSILAFVNDLFPSPGAYGTASKLLISIWRRGSSDTLPFMARSAGLRRLLGEFETKSHFADSWMKHLSSLYTNVKDAYYSLFQIFHSLHFHPSNCRLYNNPFGLRFLTSDLAYKCLGTDGIGAHFLFTSWFADLETFPHFLLLLASMVAPMEHWDPMAMEDKLAKKYQKGLEFFFRQTWRWTREIVGYGLTNCRQR